MSYLSIDGNQNMLTGNDLLSAMLLLRIQSERKKLAVSQQCKYTCYTRESFNKMDKKYNFSKIQLKSILTLSNNRMHINHYK